VTENTPARFGPGKEQMLRLDRSNSDPTTRKKREEKAMSTLRRIVSTLDAHTLWAFNAQRELRTR
jgi:hypothetical protein